MQRIVAVRSFTLGFVHKTLVINAVGLTPALLEHDLPNLKKLIARGSRSTIDNVLPAVTCTAQATYLTGTTPQQHGIVGNGWYDKENCEVRFWRQSHALVQRPYLWHEAKRRDSSFTVANCFWWFAMYSGADYTLTPRPMYPADGRKLPDLWTHPPDLRHDLQRTLGQFPLFKFWGPLAGIESTRWIVDATIELDRMHAATLTLCYLPHLDYDLQRFGPGSEEARLAAVTLDTEIGRLLTHFDGSRVIVLSEYGIVPVSEPVHINRLLRERGWLRVRSEQDRELLDAGASQAFSVADHQIAHVYLNDKRIESQVRTAIEELEGVSAIYAGPQRGEVGLDHDRAGDIVVLSESHAWFTYYYWLVDDRAPDFARTVDIHRKPGYDPVELTIDPTLTLAKLQVIGKLAARKLGFRNLLDVIGLDATIVKGSHGALAPTSRDLPVMISSQPGWLGKSVEALDVKDWILRHVFEESVS